MNYALHLWEIALPHTSNDGHSNYAVARKKWEHHALLLAGGFTHMGISRGCWRDPETGHVYDEKMHSYRIASDDPGVMSSLVELAHVLFPDQVAFFTASIGSAYIVSGSSQLRAAE